MSNPAEQRRLQQASSKKAEQGERLVKILADVFLFDYASRDGDLVRLTFRPSPTFQPFSMEARVFQHMQGEMTVDTKQGRLAAIKGHLVEDVKFGGGLLGHLDKGSMRIADHSALRPAERNIDHGTIPGHPHG